MLSINLTLKPKHPVSLSVPKTAKEKINARFVELLGKDLGLSVFNNIEQHSRDYVNALGREASSGDDQHRTCEHMGYTIRTLIMCLDPKYPTHNPELVNKVRTGYISIQELIKMDAFQRNPNAWKKELDAKNVKDQQIVKQESYKAVTDIYTCPVCRHKKTYFEQRQDRCGDEGYTNHIECVSCGYKWSINT